MSHGWTCSTKSVFGSTGPPASRTSVFRPRSVSSFAAHPPLIPDPTTIASKCVTSRMGISGRARLLDRHRRRAIELARHDLHFEHVLHHRLAREVPVDDEPLEPPVRTCGFGATISVAFEGLDDCTAHLGSEISEGGVAEGSGSGIDRIETGEKRITVGVRVILRDDYVDERRNADIACAGCVGSWKNRVAEHAYQCKLRVSETACRTNTGGDAFPNGERVARNERPRGCCAKDPEELTAL